MELIKNFNQVSYHVAMGANWEISITSLEKILKSLSRNLVMAIIGLIFASVLSLISYQFCN